MLWILLALLVAAGAFVRLAPTDAAQWHVSPVTDAAPDCAIRGDTGSARAACTLPGTPDQVLERLDVLALATPRTTRLAGDPASGRITWVTRSLVWGFPDYTTAEAAAAEGGTRLDLHARLRFGGSDLGVNAARLLGWLAALRP
jgi:uncharacterized protein (DUF1499 family)